MKLPTGWKRSFQFSDHQNEDADICIWSKYFLYSATESNMVELQLMFRSYKPIQNLQPANSCNRYEEVKWAKIDADGGSAVGGLR